MSHDESAAPYINPIHAAFALTNLDPRVKVETLLELLDTLDPFDRDRLIGLVAFAIGVDGHEMPTEEETAAARYSDFKVKCDKLLVMDHLIVHGLVLQILNQYREWSDAAHTDQAVKSIQGYIEFSRSRGTPEEELEKWKIMAESKAVQKTSDLQVTRSLYNMFCDRVAKPLLEVR